jgi:uncharacterized protein (DUF1697 family)
MTKYAAFLRGINVGNIRIKMPDLKAAFEKIGLTDVATYLQTGNIVFTSDLKIDEIKPLLEQGLSDTFRYQAYVLLYAFDSMTEIIAQYPFEKDEKHHAYVAFIDNLATLNELAELAKGLGEESNLIKLGDSVLYWKVEIGQTLNTPFAKIIAKAKYKSSVTVRNINTLEKMI